MLQLLQNHKFILLSPIFGLIRAGQHLNTQVVRMGTVLTLTKSQPT